MSHLSLPSNIKASHLTNGINALTYGYSCLTLMSQNNSLYQCIMSVHEQYINILHLIIGKKSSYLLKLNQVKQIKDQDPFVQAKIKQIINVNSTKNNKTVSVNNKKLNDNQNLFISQPLYLVINLQAMTKSIIFVFKTQQQRNIIFLGFRFFVKQAKYFYSKLSQYDPFKAQSMMLFIQADKDGGNLLDIQEILDILQKLKINKEKIQVQGDVLQINKCLYERQGLKKSNKSSDYQLTPLAFQYLLRFYSIKEELSKYFKQYCPIFKTKTRNHKNSIIDIIKSYQKPQMSPTQLKNFYQQIFLDQIITQEQIQDIIMKFPIYDGQGKQILDKSADQVKLLGFNNFCNLLYSTQNSLIDIDKKIIRNNLPQIKQKQQNNQQDTQKKDIQRKDSIMSIKNKIKLIPIQKQKGYLDYPLNDYFIYTDLSHKNIKRKQKVNYFDLAIKRGCKCIFLTISISDSIGKKQNNASNLQNANSNPTKGHTAINKNGKFISSHVLSVILDDESKQVLLLEQILRNVKTYAFQKNKLPFWLVIDLNSFIIDNNLKLKTSQINQVLETLNQTLQQYLGQDLLIIPGSKFQKSLNIPTPNDLLGKIILVSNYNPKDKKSKNKILQEQIKLPENLSLKFAFTAVKLDYERKGQTWRHICFINQDRLKSYELTQQENIASYPKKIMIFSLPKFISTANYDPQSQFRQGVQFIGQDFQKNRQFNYLIHSKFSETTSQSFGYLLKPHYMHSQNNISLYTNKDFTKPIYKIKFDILSGQKLLINNFQPKPSGFYVQIIVKGSINDQKANNKFYKSSKRTEGFYTQFDLQCQFIVYCEHMFTLLILIKSFDNNKIISGKAVSLSKMREGLRSIQLLGQRMQTGQNSYILVMYKIIEKYAKNQGLRQEEKMKKAYKQFMK